MKGPWPKVRLGDLLRKSEETIQLQPDSEYRELTVRLWGKGVVLRGIVSGTAVAAQRRYVARASQFILSRIDARNGALGIVPPELDGAIVSNDFPTYDLATDRLLPAFLGWMCRTASFVEACQRASEGTTNRVRLKEDFFLGIGIPLPPIEEQRLIVARIEELSAKIYDARSLRQQAVEEAEALRVTSLRSAIGNCNAEDVELQHVCEQILDNLHSNPRYADTGVPCVRSPNVGWGTLNLDSALRTDEEEYNHRTVRGEPRPGDIVFVREGGGTGKAALVLEGQRFSLGQRVMLLRPDEEKVVPKFFLYQLLSPIVQEDQIGSLCKGSASPHLNVGALRRFRFRLPSLSEQGRIVADLDALHGGMNALEGLQTDTTAELNALLPAGLNRAFKGDF